MESRERSIVIYETNTGKTPYQEWFNGLEKREQMIVDARLTRLRCGNLGNFESVGKGVKELKVHFGPGYRIYFGEDGKSLVVLLCAGDKSSQKKDIIRAQEYWLDYLSEE